MVAVREVIPFFGIKDEGLVIKILAFEKKRLGKGAKVKWEDGVKKEWYEDEKVRLIIEYDGKKYLVLANLKYREIKVISKEGWQSPKYGYFYTEWYAEIECISEIPTELAEEMMRSVSFTKVEKMHEAYIWRDMVVFRQEIEDYLKFWPETMWDYLAN